MAPENSNSAINTTQSQKEEYKRPIDMVAAELCQEENRDDKYRPTTELPLTSYGNEGAGGIDSYQGGANGGIQEQEYPKTSGDEEADPDDDDDDDDEDDDDDVGRRNNRLMDSHTMKELSKQLSQINSEIKQTNSRIVDANGNVIEVIHQEKEVIISELNS